MESKVLTLEVKFHCGEQEGTVTVEDNATTTTKLIEAVANHFNRPSQNIQINFADQVEVTNNDLPLFSFGFTNVDPPVVEVTLINNIYVHVPKESGYTVVMTMYFHYRYHSQHDQGQGKVTVSDNVTLNQLQNTIARHLNRHIEDLRIKFPSGIEVNDYSLPLYQFGFPASGQDRMHVVPYHPGLKPETIKKFCLIDETEHIPE
uniref:Ubiquitin-like domain-containing protein n=1 Tax=Ditylenchus dipsaci TaxID=166011 RepID=A0A915D3R7_9BILA